MKKLRKIISLLILLYFLGIAAIWIDGATTGYVKSEYAVVLGNQVHPSGESSERLKARLLVWNARMMNMLKKLLKILLWLIGGSVLLLVLTLAGFYLYFAIPMQERITKLKNGDAWAGCPQPAYVYPARFVTLFEDIEKGAIHHVLARYALEDWPAKETRSLGRNLQALVAGLEIERHFSQTQQVWLAMNNGYMAYRSDNCPIRGMNDAAHYYFGMPPAQLSVAEMALLVGIVKSANYYNPFDRPEKAQQRRDQVLQRLLGKHLITEAEYQTALKEPLPTESHLP